MIKMKKLSTIIMALALVLGMSQCKKQETTSNDNGGDMVYITLEVSNGENVSMNVDNGSRHDLSPRLGMVKFENGDVLHVGYNGKYIGQLTYQDGAFGGTLPEATSGVTDNLHFYFLGGKGKGSDSPSANATSFTFSIADQHDVLPVLCYGASTQTYGNGTKYSAVLEYKCALVKFDLVNHVEDYSVKLKNVPTQATVNFANPTATTAIVAKANQTNANMTLYGEPGNAAYRWAILLPGTNLDNAEGLTIGSTVANHVMDNNMYIDEGISISNTVIPAAPNALYAVKTSGNVLTKFTVGVGKKVYFSKANLKYTAAAGYHFHDTQFDEIYPALSNGIPAQSGYHSNVQLSNLSDMDRFCWGYKVNATPGGDQYVEGNHDLDSDTDWGSQLTTEGRHWRTLTADEWDYLLNSRGARSFMMVDAIIPDGSSFLRCEGLLLFPDGFNHTQIQGLYTTNTPATVGFNTAWYNKKDFTQTEMDLYGRYLYHPIDKLRDSNNNYMFITNPNSNMYKLLAAGCVFLPALGYRYGTEMTKYGCYQNAQYIGQGFYWTATNIYSEGHEYSKYLWFGIHGASNGTSTNNEEYVGTASSTDRKSGMCVRLVWDADPD